MTTPIHVMSEIGKLKTVLLKRPGKEVENLTPEIMERLLFDDIPHLPVIQKEHDAFAQALIDRGVEVLYLEKLTAEAIDAGECKEKFVDRMLDESNLETDGVKEGLKKYLLSFDTQEMVDRIMAGIRKKDVTIESHHLADVSSEEVYPFYMDPMPNLYFTRDPAASIGNGLTINHMAFEARNRESLFIEAIMKYHPRFANQHVEIWRDRNHTARIEGGDELVLNDKVLAIGISQRTSAKAIEQLTLELFERNSNFEKVLAIKIPNVRAMMHLDTVFTMVDYDKFTIHPGIQKNGGEVDTYILEKGEEAGTVKMTHRSDLQEILREALNVPKLTLIPCGGGDAIAAPREQWNDGSNTLAIAPGVVVTYDRNYVSNELLRSHGVEVIEIASSELSRGRGGPRCMSMPLIREDLPKH
ncbi:arginine deiminase [Carnobacterium inhibens]|uniref:Arginine deiminase n=1 Tax=Carnobacterium inhibens TaxID=147709 RepID=A0ABR7T9K9_9LACT|nr:arginine deiminase [Carnobacterium inhibens]MBC9824460.1 arginine deiminase [Carnobacterium inhibens]